MYQSKLKTVKKNNRDLKIKIKKIEEEIDKRIEMNPSLADRSNKFIKKDFKQVNLFEKAFNDLINMKSAHFELCSKSDDLFTAAINQMKQSTVNHDQPKNKKMKLNSISIGNSFNISNDVVDKGLKSDSNTNLNTTFNKTFNNFSDDVIKSKEPNLNKTIIKYNLAEKSSESSNKTFKKFDLPIFKETRSKELSLNKNTIITSDHFESPLFSKKSPERLSIESDANRTFVLNQTITISKIVASNKAPNKAPTNSSIKTQSKLKKTKSDTILNKNLEIKNIESKNVEGKNKTRKNSTELNKTFTTDSSIDSKQVSDEKVSRSSIKTSIKTQSKLKKTKSDTILNKNLESKISIKKNSTLLSKTFVQNSTSKVNKISNDDIDKKAEVTDPIINSLKQTSSNNLLGCNLLNATSLEIPTPSKYNLRRSVRLVKKNYAY